MALELFIQAENRKALGCFLIGELGAQVRDTGSRLFVDFPDRPFVFFSLWQGTGKLVLRRATYQNFAVSFANETDVVVDTVGFLVGDGAELEIFQGHTWEVVGRLDRTQDERAYFRLNKDVSISKGDLVRVTNPPSLLPGVSGVLQFTRTAEHDEIEIDNAAPSEKADRSFWQSKIARRLRARVGDMYDLDARTGSLGPFDTIEIESPDGKIRVVDIKDVNDWLLTRRESGGVHRMAVPEGERGGY